MCILSFFPPWLIIGRGFPGEKLEEQQGRRETVSWLRLGSYCPNILLLAPACFWNSVRQLNFIPCGLALNM